MQKFEEPASPCGKLRSAPREGGWHHVSHARPGFWQHDESQSEATPSAIDVTSGWQKKPAQPGGSRNKAVALDLCRDQHERFRCGQPAAGHYQCNKDTSPDDIVFNIPASTAPLLDVPVPGFDPGTQTWTITLQSPLPAITNTVSIDGYTEAPLGVPYFYPNAVSSAVQSIALTGSPTGGTFTLTIAVPFTVSTVTLPYSATAATVQAALGPYVGGINNITVTGGPLPDTALTITFQNGDGGQAISDLVGNGSGLTGGTSPGVLVETTVAGGTATGDPT